jgi:hypothetical protein
VRLSLNGLEQVGEYPILVKILTPNKKKNPGECSNRDRTMAASSLHVTPPPTPLLPAPPPPLLPPLPRVHVTEHKVRELGRKAVLFSSGRLQTFCKACLGTRFSFEGMNNTLATHTTHCITGPPLKEPSCFSSSSFVLTNRHQRPSRLLLLLCIKCPPPFPDSSATVVSRTSNPLFLTKNAGFYILSAEPGTHPASLVCTMHQETVFMCM